MNRKIALQEANSDLQLLYAKFLELKETLDAKMLSDFKRNLPFADVLFDRWEKAQLLGFGEGTSVYDSCHVFGDVEVGKNTWIGPFTILDGSGKLSIGSNCSISAGVHIYTHDTVEWAVSGGEMPYKYTTVEIGDHCYIGPQTIISSGVKIGDGCIVGANSFVNQSFPAGSKIAGNPAKLIS